MTTADDAPVTVGVLGLHESKETKAILNATEALGHETVWLRRENINLLIEGGAIDLEPDVDVIANRLLLSTSEHPAEDIGLARMLEGCRPMLNQPNAVMTAMHKAATAVALAQANLPVPDALIALSSDLLNAHRELFGDKAVYKTAIGTHGGGSWVVGMDDPVNPQVGNRQGFLQEFIEGPDPVPADLRVYVVGGDIIGAMYRYAPEGEWRTNVSFGGDITDATNSLDDSVREMATQASEVVGLDYAGVDLIQNGSQWYILEVNPTAGFRGLFKATGTSPAPYIAKLAIERAGGSVDTAQVEKLADTLDDSTPTCMPRVKPSLPREPPVIGYIEEVIVSGTRGSRQVKAKSDTGATRTSIDSRLAADIGTGPIKDIVTVRSGSAKDGRSRPIVDIVVGVGGEQHTVAASVEDRSHMNYQLLLGRDILEHYHVDVTRHGQGSEQEETEE